MIFIINLAFSPSDVESPGDGVRLKTAGGETGKEIEGYTINTTSATLRLLEEQFAHSDQIDLLQFTLEDQERMDLEAAILQKKLEASPHLRAFSQWQKAMRMLEEEETIIAEPTNVDTSEAGHFAFIIQFNCVADQEFALDRLVYTKSNYTFTAVVNSTHGKLLLRIPKLIVR